MNPQTALVEWRSVLAVVAHPDDESFALWAVLARFAAAGATVSVLCLHSRRGLDGARCPGDARRHPI